MCAVVVKDQVGRAMMIISIGLAGVGVLVAVAGLKCTRYLDGDNQLKNRIALTGGSFFILSGEFHILNKQAIKGILIGCRCFIIHLLGIKMSWK